MTISIVEFTELEKIGKAPLESLAPKVGKVYVVAITRSGCPACDKQKLKLDRLAATLAKKHGNKVIFKRVHVNYSPDSHEESWRSKDLLHHYFYPTNLILTRSRDRGAIELYRNTAPDMRELRRNIERALELARYFEKNA